MNLQQTTERGKGEAPAETGTALPSEQRYLTLLIEGTAINMPEIDSASFKDFRAGIARLAIKIPDRLPDNDKLALIREVIREFERYRNRADAVMRERLSSWRTLVVKLLAELLPRVGIDSSTAEAAPLVQRVGSLLTSEEIQGFRIQLANLLRLESHPAAQASNLRATDHSVSNHNATGLRGGGAAVEHLERIIERGGNGFVVLFGLGCLDVIGERFGPEAIQDSVMAVSAFLAQSLRSDDAIYHWSDSSLLAILESHASEQMLSAAMQRVVNNNRDITIQLNDRTVMLRVPLHFQINPISHFQSANDLYKLAPEQVKPW